MRTMLYWPKSVVRQAVNGTSMYICEPMRLRILLLTLAAAGLAHVCCAAKYQTVLDEIARRREVLANHPLFAFLADDSVTPVRRMRFAPYWTFFAMGAADIIDTWIRYEHPKNELEERINRFVDEDDFHYNLFLHDVEHVLGYGSDRFGSFQGVVRHLWSDETRTVRQFFYDWIDVVKKNRNDPVAILTTFEAGEAGLLDIMEVTYSKIYAPEGGLKDLKYFGKEHIELERSHNVTGWFGEQADISEKSLANVEITDEQRQLYEKIASRMFDRYTAMYDALYSLEMADESIYPEKFQVEGFPAIRDFPYYKLNRPRDLPSDSLHAKEKRTRDDL